MWDQEVPQNIQTAWLSWLKDLSNLDQVRIARCIKPQDFTDSNSVLELHHFSDASQKAYGCCSYIRCINQNGQVDTALIISKSRVAPMKQLTVPRLELQAAVLSTRMDAFLRKELEFLIDSHFWSDSEIVLKYIKNETRRFQLFVENRVSIIHQLSSPDKWHHISGRNNPADLISRGTRVQQINQPKWLTGPEFLQTYKAEWQIEEKYYVLNEKDPDVKKEVVKVVPGIKSHNIPETPIDPDDVIMVTAVTVGVVNLGDSDNPAEKLINHYSSWYRLKRAIAWLLKFQELLKNMDDYNRDKANISIQDIKKAEKIVIKYAQKKHYGKELKKLSQGDPVNRSSNLVSLNPVMDNEGIIHWIPKARSLIKKLRNRCMTCRKL